MDNNRRPPRYDGRVPRGNYSHSDALRERMRQAAPDEPTSATKTPVTTPSSVAKLADTQPASEAEQNQPDTKLNSPKTPHKFRQIRLPKKLALPKSGSLPDNLKKFGIVTVVVVGFLAFSALAVHIVIVSRLNPVMPPGVRDQAKFVVYYPVKNGAIKIDKSTFKYDKGNELLSYIGYTGSKNKLIISEQPTPDALIDGQPAYDLLISRLQGYSSFNSINGKVSLTRPKEFRGTSFAVMNAKGTLFFIRPAKNLPDKDWQHIFNSLEVLK